MAKFNQITRRSFADMDPEFLMHYGILVDAVNNLAGYNGAVVLNDHIDMQGNSVRNLAAPTQPTDAVSSTVASSTYGAAALRPQLESTGSQPLQTMRRVNDQNQRESYSSFLNATMSTPPNANTTLVLFSGGGGSTIITIPAGFLQFADGTRAMFAARTDFVTNPAVIAISSISSVSDVVTVVLVTPISVGSTDILLIAGVTTTFGTGDFNGTFPVVTVISSTSFTYIVPGLGTATGSGGSISTSGVFYYYLVKNTETLGRISLATAADTPRRRLATSTDSRQLVAVATVDANGGVSSSSAAGGTPTSTVNAGSFF